MTPANNLASGRVVAAFAIATFADFIQLPLTALSLTGFLTIPVELFDIVTDVAVCVFLSALLGGFHWVLAPSFLAEAVPFVDVLPTWTAAVALIVVMRKKEVAHARASATTLDVPAIPTGRTSGAGQLASGDRAAVSNGAS